MKMILYRVGNLIYRFLIKSRKEMNLRAAQKKYDIHESVSF